MSPDNQKSRLMRLVDATLRLPGSFNTDDEYRDFYDALEVQEFHKGEHDSWIFFIDIRTRHASSERGNFLGRVLIDARIETAQGLVYQVTILAVNGKQYTGLYNPRYKDWNTNWCCLNRVDKPAQPGILPLKLIGFSK